MVALGSFVVYMASYYRISQEDLSVNEDTFNQILPFVMMVTTLVFPIGNYLVDAFGG